MRLIQAIVVGLIFTTVSVPVFAQNGNQIELHKGFFKPLKFSQNDGERHKVYNFSGMSHKPHFEEVMGQNPAALAEAKKATKYNGVALVGSLTLLAGSTILLLDTIDEAQAVSDGDLSSSTDYGTSLGLVIVGGVVAVIGARLSSKHLKKGVSMFNEGQSSAERLHQEPKYELSVSPQIVSSNPGLKLAISW